MLYMMKSNCTQAQKQALGGRLKQLREDAGLSQQKVANELGITRSTYTYYELGKTLPNIFTLRMLAEIFHISLEDFLGDYRPLRIVS